MLQSHLFYLGLLFPSVWVCISQQEVFWHAGVDHSLPFHPLHSLSFPSYLWNPFSPFLPVHHVSPGLHYSQQEAGPAGINTDDSTSRLKNASESKPVYRMFGRGGGTLSLLKNIIKATGKIIKHVEPKKNKWCEPNKGSPICFIVFHTEICS